MRDFEKQRNEGFYDIELAYEQIIEQSVVDKMREIESLSQPVKDDDGTKKGFQPGKTIIHLIMVHALTRVVWRRVKGVVNLPTEDQVSQINLQRSRDGANQNPGNKKNTEGVTEQFQASLPGWAGFFQDNFKSQENLYQFMLFVIMYVVYKMVHRKVRKDLCNLNFNVFDGVAEKTVNILDPQHISSITQIDQSRQQQFQKQQKIDTNQLKHNRNKLIGNLFFEAALILVPFVTTLVSQPSQYEQKVEQYYERLHERGGSGAYPKPYEFQLPIGSTIMFGLKVLQLVFKGWGGHGDQKNRKESLENKEFHGQEPKNNEQINNFVNGLLSPLQNFIQKIVDYYNKGLMNKIVIGTIATLGVTILFKVTCRQILNGIMQLEISKERFSKLIEKIVFETVKPTHNILFAGETVDDSNPDFPIVKLKFRLLDKMFEESNTVASQRHHIFKEILKNMPQNVFVSKIEYVSYDRNNDNTKVPQNTESSVKEPPINRLEVARNNTNATINLFQVLYTYGSRRDPRKATSKPQFADGTYYYPQELNHVDREMIRYAKEHEQLYRFLNRKWISRNYVFDIMTDPLRPKMLSPSVPSYYVCRFSNKTNENLKQHFKEKTDIFHLKRIDRPPENKDSKETRFVNDVYEVHLKVTKFSERNIEQIIDDIPEGLQAINVTRPLDKSFKHTKCKEFHIYPSTRSNFLKRLFWSNKCEIPDYLKHPIDDRVIESFKKRQVKERQRIKKVKQKLMLDFKDVIDQEYSNAELQKLEQLRLSNTKKTKTPSSPLNPLNTKLSPIRKPSKKHKAYKGYDQTLKPLKSLKPLKPMKPLKTNLEDDDRW